MEVEFFPKGNYNAGLFLLFHQPKDCNGQGLKNERQLSHLDCLYLDVKINACRPSVSGLKSNRHTIIMSGVRPGELYNTKAK